MHAEALISDHLTGMGGTYFIIVSRKVCEECEVFLNTSAASSCSKFIVVSGFLGSLEDDMQFYAPPVFVHEATSAFQGSFPSHGGPLT